MNRPANDCGAVTRFKQGGPVCSYMRCCTCQANSATVRAAYCATCKRPCERSSK